MTTRSLLRSALSVSVLLAATAVACSSAGPGGFPDPTPPLGSDGPDSGFGSSGGARDANVSDAFQGCASSKITGTISPVHLVIAFDESSSMCADVSANNDNAPQDCSKVNSKWQQSRAALKAFFLDPQSRGVNASIIPWSSLLSCAISSTPLTPADHPLPDPGGMLDRALAAVMPFGTTPTGQAIDAAKTYGMSLKSMVAPGEPIIIALVTDGIPGAPCSSMPHAQAAAQAATAAGFPVYVIGVGQLLTNLNDIAQSAGTNGGKAILVQNNVAVEFNNALKDIKKKNLGCGVRLPAAPPGEMIDYKKVNLTHTDNMGVEQALAQSQDCKDPKGWRYVPNETAPTSIEFCADICAEMKVNEKGSIGIVLGCATRVSIPK
jgi:hypothetical protein